MANVRVDGQWVESVGVRIKGGLSAFNKKKPLKIDFNHYVPGRHYDGLKKINLQNADYDRSLQRDALGYAIFRMAGVKSPRTAYAKVFINGEYHGVYVVAEQVDKTFLKNQFAGDEGILYKNKICEVEVEAGEGSLAYWQEMNQIAATLSGQNFVTAIEAVLDTDAFLRFFLVEQWINAVDNPIDADCNYYLYRIPGIQKLYWIPWDLNYAFYNGKNYKLYETGINPVFKRMMETPVYREHYTNLACDMLQYLFKEEALHPLIEQNAQLIRNAVAEDPRYDYTLADFDLGTDQMKAYVSQRRQDFLLQLASLNVSCPTLLPAEGIVINEFVASANAAGGIPDPQGQYPDWIELYNNSSVPVSLSKYYLSDHRHNLKHWRFPSNTEIAPKSYLIVWADRDIADTGLHADFKLDKNGGTVFLTFENLEIADSVAYGEQFANIAMARVPNGTGNFVGQAPTFAANNTPPARTNGQPPRQEMRLFPNPAADWLTVCLAKEPKSLNQISVADMSGRLVLTQSADQTCTLLNIGHLPPGNYQVLARGESFVYQQRITINR